VLPCVAIILSSRCYSLCTRTEAIRRSHSYWNEYKPESRRSIPICPNCRNSCPKCYVTTTSSRMLTATGPGVGPHGVSPHSARHSVVARTLAFQWPEAVHLWRFLRNCPGRIRTENLLCRSRLSIVSDLDKMEPPALLIGDFLFRMVRNYSEPRRSAPMPNRHTLYAV
jgi:hypothetical protein